jgi:phasin family protein
MVKNYETLADTLTSANKDAIDAFMKFNAALTAGLQEISNHVLASTQNTIELNLATGKAILGIKTPQEMVEIQSGWMRQCFSAAVSGSTKLSEISTKIASQAVTPVQSHFQNSIGKIADNVMSLSSKAA